MRDLVGFRTVLSHVIDARVGFPSDIFSQLVRSELKLTNYHWPNLLANSALGASCIAFIMSAQLRVAYLGPQGTYTHQVRLLLVSFGKHAD